MEEKVKNADTDKPKTPIINVYIYIYIYRLILMNNTQLSHKSLMVKGKSKEKHII